MTVTSVSSAATAMNVQGSPAPTPNIIDRDGPRGQPRATDAEDAA
jgi:hypothetical protein